MNGWRVVSGMTMATVVAAMAAAACSSSKNGGSCSFACATENPMAQMASNDTCTQCTESMCGQQGTNAYGSGWQSGDVCGGGACASFISCIAACSCDNTQCLTGCTLSQSCEQASAAFESCQSTNCGSQCGTTGTGSSSSSGGTGSSSGGSSSGSIGAGTVTDGVCVGGGGAPTCPSTSVVGCCVISSAEECYYSPNYTASMGMTICSDASGSWQASP